MVTLDEKMRGLVQRMQEYVDQTNMFGFYKDFRIFVINHWQESEHFEQVCIDTGYDNSCCPERTGSPLACVAKQYFQFINSATGQRVATFQSGHGFACETFEDKLNDFYGDKCKERLQSLIQEMELNDMGEHSEDFMDRIYGEEVPFAEEVMIRFSAFGMDLEPYLCSLVRPNDGTSDCYNLGCFGVWTLNDFIENKIYVPNPV